VKLSGSDLAPYARNLFEKGAREKELELATMVVLDERKGAKPN
jgi:hypothetical protein